MKMNMSFPDRFIRLMLAVIFASLYFTGNIPAGTVATILWAIGVVFAITALVGYCPLYALLHIRTAGKSREHKK